MRTVFDNPQKQPPFATFRCQLDSALTLIDRNPQLTDLLGFESFHQAPNELTACICSNWVERTFQELMQQLAVGDDAEFVFPVFCDDTGIRWLLCRGQKYTGHQQADCLQGVLVDVTRLKNYYDKRMHIIEQYRVILEQTGEVMFDWDISGDSMQFSEGWMTKFGYLPQTDCFTEAIIQSGHVHPEDAQNLLHQLAVMQEGRAFLDLEARISDAEDRWLWCKIRACGIYNTIGQLTHVIGLIIDIDDEKKARRALQAQAEQDSLTKLLNASTTKQLVEQYLQACTDHAYCAMLIIDLDDFKRINDQHGHLFGDEVLIRVANILKHSFRNDDVVGRIGGEEFLVLMKNVSDSQKIMERCSHLLEAIRTSSPACPLTASIGVSIVSGKKPKYDELFLRTDKALYQAKSAGKNRFTLSK